MNDSFSQVKHALLGYVQSSFEEMEESAALRHQERFALLEDAFENATDVDELRVAFEQWHSDHNEDLELEQDVDEMWDGAIGGLLDEELESDTEMLTKKTKAIEDDEFDEDEEEEADNEYDGSDEEQENEKDEEEDK